MNNFSLQDNKKNWNLFLNTTKEINDAHTIVGFQREDGKTEESGVLVVDVAIANEFGTERIPERSFMRTYFDHNKDMYARLGAKLYNSCLDGSTTVEQSLNFIGLTAVSGIQKQIDATTTPPNAPATIKKKGSSHPLIDTGQMRQSVTYKIIK